MKFENKDKLYFTSDLHLHHANVIKHDSRPFTSVEEMNEELIANWNKTISKDDIVFYLGDISFGNFTKTKESVDRLNGKIHFIMGNHDNWKIISKLDRFESVSGLMDIYVKDDEITDKKLGSYQHIVLCHYPIVSWNRQHYGAWHLFGHTHHSFYTKGNQINDELYKRKCLDMGTNGWGYYPASYDQVKKEMSTKIIGTFHHD
jgi:calcineurin-like phosphoesterase family protein